MDIEIKKVEVKQIAISTKKTFYICICWNANGVMFANGPSEDKRYQEQYALSMSKNTEHTCIYSFDIDIPNFK